MAQLGVTNRHGGRPQSPESPANRELRRARRYGPSRRKEKPFFWISTRGAPQTGVHVAFEAENRELVDAFHAAALDAGGTDNGAPGLRAIYHPAYYGAYVLDPDGNNAEAVCHKPE